MVVIREEERVCTEAGNGASYLPVVNLPDFRSNGNQHIFVATITATNSPTGYSAILQSGNTSVLGGLSVNPNTGRHLQHRSQRLELRRHYAVRMTHFHSVTTALWLPEFQIPKRGLHAESLKTARLWCSPTASSHSCAQP